MITIPFYLYLFMLVCTGILIGAITGGLVSIIMSILFNIIETKCQNSKK